MFQRDGSGWTQLEADLDGEADDDRFGGAVAITDDGNRVAVGSYLNDGGCTNSGHVRIFDLVGGGWTQVGADIDGPARRRLGGRISDDGNRIAVSATSAVGDDSPGTTFVNDWNDVSWVAAGQPIVGEADDDTAGKALSLSADGSVVAIGAPSNVGEGLDGDGGAGGHVRVYRQVAGTWTQVGTDLDGPAGSNFVTSVSLSADGARLLASGPNPSVIRLFILSGEVWTLATSPTFETDRRAGSSVAISADGSTGAVGAEYGDTDVGNAAGIVRVYSLP